MQLTSDSSFRKVVTAKASVSLYWRFEEDCFRIDVGASCRQNIQGDKVDVRLARRKLPGQSAPWTLGDMRAASINEVGRMDGSDHWDL
jgi:hypothetical protein